MFKTVPQLTDMGKTLILLAAGGTEFQLTKFQAGNGILSSGETPSAMTALKNVVVDDIGITQAEDTEDEVFIQVTGSFNNYTDVQSDFTWTEFGLIAEDGDGNEYLFAYAYDAENAEAIRASGGDVVVEQTISMIVAIGDSENITVNVIPDATYASKAAFDAHVANQNNPHNVTLTQLGAAAASHTHSASDISSGTLPASRGGTGYTSLEDLAAALSNLLSLSYVVGVFAGDGTVRKEITLGFQPSAVVLIPLLGGGKTFPNSAPYYVTPNNDGRQTYLRDYTRGGFYFSPNNNLYHSGCGDSYATCDADTLFNRGHGGAAVTNTGFAIGGANGGRVDLNLTDVTYLYIAFR